jgi:hypothetical protein
MFSEVLHVAVYGMEYCLQDPHVPHVYEPCLRARIGRMRQDLAAMAVELATAEAAWYASHQTISVDDVAATTLMWLRGLRETPESVGGVFLNIMRDSHQWSVEMGADYPFELPNGKGYVAYDTGLFETADEAFQAALADVLENAEGLASEITDRQF